MEPEAVENMDLFEIIKKRSSRFGRYACHECLQQRIAQKFRIEPGSELKAAIQSALKKYTV